MWPFLVVFGIFMISYLAYGVVNPHYFMWEDHPLVDPVARKPYLNCDSDTVKSHIDNPPTDKMPTETSKLVTRGIVGWNQKCLVYNLPFGQENVFIKGKFYPFYLVSVYGNYLMVILLALLFWSYWPNIKNFIKKQKQLEGMDCEKD